MTTISLNPNLNCLVLYGLKVIEVVLTRAMFLRLYFEIHNQKKTDFFQNNIAFC